MPFARDHIVTGSQRIGILGGTFDPIHNGHLRVAVEFYEAINVGDATCRIHLIPCRLPPHREIPDATPIQRLEMLRLAVEGQRHFYVDEREMASPNTSYTIDTLHGLRADYPAAHLIMALGMDAYAGITCWHRWQEILEIASLVVCTRPGVDLSTEADAFRHRHVSLADMTEPGQIALLDIAPLEISSSALRRRCRLGKSLHFLLPPQIVDYIAENGLYR